MLFLDLYIYIMLIYLVCVSAGTSIADQITADAIMHEPSILLWPISISTASLCTTYKPRRQEGSSKYVDIYMLENKTASSIRSTLNWFWAFAAADCRASAGFRSGWLLFFAGAELTVASGPQTTKVGLHARQGMNLSEKMIPKHRTKVDSAGLKML